MANSQASSPLVSSLAPSLDSLNPPRNIWGQYGPYDQLGMLNLLTRSVVVDAAKEVRTGIRVSLDWPLDKPKYPSYRRPQFKHEFINRSKDGYSLRVINDDQLNFNTQCSSQWDGFRHFGNLNDCLYYNKTTHGELTTTNVLGIDAWTESGGIVGRGVLLDLARWASQRSIDLRPFEAYQIPFDFIKQLIQEEEITFRAGDILIIRFGFTAAFNALSLGEQKALAERPTADFSGIESSMNTLRFLWKNQFAAVASDSPAFERSPPVSPEADPSCILHEWLLAGWGMPIGELFDLEKLSEVCMEQNRHTFFFSSMPLKVPGGVASPPNAVAIF